MRDSWEIRFAWIQTILQWFALVVGVGLSLLQFGLEPQTVAASLGLTAYTVAMQMIPNRTKGSPLVGGLLALLGVVTSLFAIALTGGLDSAFVLYLAVPVFSAAAFHGSVLGAVTTLAAIVGLIGVAASSGVDLLSPTLALMVMIYVLVGLTFSQARRILIDSRNTGADAAQMQRLESAHHLLEDLAALASSSELNPIAIGRNALRDLAVHVPFASGSIAIIDDTEEITVATRGQPGPPRDASTFPITLQRKRVGTLQLWPVAGGSLDVHADQIAVTMQSAALAFANVLLLQSIAHRAVREERVRLARELHDEIGPSLVSIGLGLDLALQSGEFDGESRRHLESMRGSVGELVEEVRSTVTHLRASDTASLVEHATALAADTPAEGPSFVVDIDELAPPRPREAGELASIMTEAVRNAVEHADAGVIRIDGFVRSDRGEFRVTDDGRGMQPTADGEQRYGLIGMRERADKIGARLSVESAVGSGTTISISWGPR